MTASRCALAIGLLFLPAGCAAGPLFGTIRGPNGRPAARASIVVRCGNSTYRAAAAADGDYSLQARETARCSLEVNYNGQVARAGIYSYNEPTRYDFDMTIEGGRAVLRRR